MSIPKALNENDIVKLKSEPEIKTVGQRPCDFSFEEIDETQPHFLALFASSTNKLHVGFGASICLPATVKSLQRAVLGCTLWKVFNLPKNNDSVTVTFKSPQHKHSAASQIACVSRHVGALAAGSGEASHYKPGLLLKIVDGGSEFTMDNVPMSTVRSLQVQRLMQSASVSKESVPSNDNVHSTVKSELFGFPLESIKVVNANTGDDKNDTVKKTTSTDDNNNDDDNSAGDDNDNHKHSKLFAILVDEECKKRPMDGLTDEVGQNRAKLSKQSNGSVWNIDMIMKSGEIAVSDEATAVRNAHTAFNQLVKKFLSSLRTFDEPTPLQGNHFVRLRTVDHSGEALAALMANGVMTIFNHNENDNDDAGVHANDLHANDVDAQRADQLFETSDDNLVLLGEAGQGKTSLLRHWMQKFNTEAQLVLYVRADALWHQFEPTGAIDAAGLIAVVKKGFNAALSEADRKDINQLIETSLFNLIMMFE